MKVQVYRREDGKWDWRAKARNGRIVATSGGQGYVGAYEAWRGWDAFWCGDNWPTRDDQETVR